MDTKTTDRERLDAAFAAAGVPIFNLIFVPFVAAYLCLVLALTGAPNLTGPFIVTLAAISLATMFGRWRFWRPSARGRAAVRAAAAVLGLVLAALVSAFGWS